VPTNRGTLDVPGTQLGEQRPVGERLLSAAFELTVHANAEAGMDVVGRPGRQT
jgi:hypothetical protein